MGILWLILTTFIGYIVGVMFTHEHEILSAFVGFCLGFSVFFFAPVKDEEH